MSADLEPQVLKSVDEVYDPSSLDFQKARYHKIASIFKESFQKEHQFISRAPGRVNLIGEHIDYSGYSVLPMAIENDIVMAVGVNSTSKICLVNLNEKKFGKREIDITTHVIDPKIHEWSNYFMAGFKRFCEEMNISNPVGMDIVVDGIVPSGAGLSSSSAMVCCSVLATAFANNKLISKKRIAEIAIQGERYVGVEGGGMDQSISMMAELGKAKLVDFNPLGVSDVNLPSSCVFVIANSMVTSDKHVTAPRNYNLRVVECRLASVLLNKYLEEELNIKGEEKEPVTLIQVQNKFKLSFDQLISYVEKFIQKSPYTREQLSTILNISIEELTKRYMSKFPIEAEGFKIYARSMHVFTEASRVYKFKEICSRSPYESQVKELGELMNASQESCRDLFNCSCEELDQLTRICIESGAFGSRLTGAGWGGCTVSIIPVEILDSFLIKVKQAYFVREEWKSIMNQIIFASKPANGAVIVKQN